MQTSSAATLAPTGDTPFSLPVSMVRTTPPAPPILEIEIRRTLAELSNSELLGTLLRHHRFGGTPRDKAAGAAWLGKRFDAPPESDRVVVTNGTQNALFMTMASVVGSGGTLLVEALSYYGFRRMAGILGVKIERIDMDEDGALPDAFEARCRQGTPKALFLNPTLHNPTTYIMSRQRRLDLIAVARKYGVVIIEDDVYGLLPSEAPPPIAALGPDVTWCCTGLAKCVAPGLKTGYLLAPDAETAQGVLRRFDTTSTWHISPISGELAIDWITNGVASRVMDAVREEASARQQIAQDTLCGQVVRTQAEALHLWLTLPTRWTPQTFVEAAAARGVLLRSGDMFALQADDTPNALRVVIGSPQTRDELSWALSQLRELLN